MAGGVSTNSLLPVSPYFAGYELDPLQGFFSDALFPAFDGHITEVPLLLPRIAIWGVDESLEVLLLP